nr:IS110 family transposase [Bifidobacterium longum]
MLAGHDEDLAHESTRHINRLRSLLLQTPTPRSNAS